MTKAATKASKKPKDATAKKAGPKLVVANAVIGHNSGEKNPEAIKCLDELMHIEAQKKALAKGALQVRNRLKTEFGILSTSVARELALRKLDPDVRTQVETNHEDFKKMLGYQPQLDFAGDKPTDASIKAQPSEEKYSADSDSDEGAESDSAPLPQRAGVIRREG